MDTSGNTDSADRTDPISVLARELWQGFTANERTAVRFGMFPADKMRAAEAGFTDPDHGRLLAVALMECAKRDGGMRV